MRVAAFDRSPLRIALTGFMGSGKTTVGRLLAARLEWQFIDLDATVEHRTGKSVPQIFSQEGEETFRRAEGTVLTEVLQQPQTVIALGGGAPTWPVVRDLLADDGALILFHLHAPFSVLYERCVTQARDPRATPRPLLSEPEAAERRYEHRLQIYAAIAHRTIDVAAMDAQQVVAEILRTRPTWDQSQR